MVMAIQGPEGDLPRRVAALEAAMLALTTTGSLQSASSVNADGTLGIIIKDGKLYSANFDGDLNVPSVGTQGFGIGGPFGAAAIGDLLLRPGSIGNDALTNPLITAFAAASTQPATFTTAANTTVATTSITVPAGFTEVTLLTTMIAAGFNPGASSDNLWAGIGVAGAFTGGSYSFPMGVDAGFSTMNAQHFNVVHTGLTGGQVITVNANAWTTVATWAASVSNVVTLNVVGFFTR